LKLKFIGGCKQIGGQAIELESKNRVYLFDYGILMDKKPTLPPLDFDVKNLDIIFLSHAHLDHSGGLPLFFSGSKSPILIMTPTTRVLSKILIDDMLRLSEYYLPFMRNELMDMINKTSLFSYNQTLWHHLKGIEFLIIDAGHIPGSASFICKINGKRILYTGDVNHRTTRLLNGMSNNFPKIDYVIMESTYGNSDHPPRVEVEKDFVSAIENIVVSKNGTVLVPAFGVGRSQEIMCILHHYNVKFPVYVDGMARSVSRALLNHLEILRDEELYRNAVENSYFISVGKNKHLERQNAVSNPGVIIAPSGMLKGGTAIFYSEELINNPDNAIYLVSFQLPDTLGRQILETQIWKDGKTKIKAEIKHFPLSSHSGKSELLSFVDYIHNKSNGNTTFFIVHGDEDNTDGLYSAMEEKGISTFVPNLGEEFQIL